MTKGIIKDLKPDITIDVRKYARRNRILSFVLAGSMLVSATSCAFSQRADRQEIIDAAESFAKGASSLDSKKILKNVETMDHDDADEFKEKISLDNMNSDEHDVKQVIADTIEYMVDENSVEIKKDKAFCDVEFSIVDYVDATCDLKGKSDEFIREIKSCEKTTEYSLSLELIKSDDKWLVTVDCLDNLDDLYSFIDYEFVFGLFNRISEEDFFSALEYIGINKSETEIMENTSFSFEGDDADFKIDFCIDAYSDNDNYYGFTRCVDEATAKNLFDYYYSDYEYVFYNKDFNGTSSHEVNSTTAFVLVDGVIENRNNNTYTPYHDAIFLYGNTVIIVMASDDNSALEKEVDDFLDVLGYPHP